MRTTGKKRTAGQQDTRVADQIRKNCIAELKLFRSNVHQALASFQLKIEGEIEQVIELFANRKIGVTDEEILEKKRTVEDMTASLKRLKLKTNKGRKKDIKRIETVIKLLRDKTDTIT